MTPLRLDATLACEARALRPIWEAMGRPRRLTAGALARSRALRLLRAPGVAPGLAPADAAATLTTLSWNVALLDRPYLHTRLTMPEIQARRPALLDHIQTTGAQLVLLQEVFDPKDAALLEREAKRLGFLSLSQGHRRHGLMTLARQEHLIPIKRATGFFKAQNHLERWPGPGIKRGWLRWSLRHRSTGLELTVINTHLTAFPSWWATRNRQCRELGLLSRPEAADATIVGGDLNAGPTYPRDSLVLPNGGLSRGWWRNAVTVALLRHYGTLRDAAAEGGVAATGVTATDANSLYRRNYAGTELPARLDHLLVRGALRTASAEIVFKERTVEGQSGMVEPSDHYGVVCAFTV